MKIYCCGCEQEVEARLTNGEEIYHLRNQNNRKPYHSYPFWKCDDCGNYVGCHHKTDNPTTPLGVIPTPEIRDLRKEIHALIDPYWKSGKISRGKLYRMLSEELGYSYHTANIKSVDEVTAVMVAFEKIVDEVLL